MVLARNKQKLDPASVSVMEFHVWPTDIDVSIMNHAALLTVMETGRIDLMVRTGFFSLARKRKWYFVTASLDVQYLRPLRIFQKATLMTRIFHVDDPWIYMEHKITRNEKEVAICLVKCKVKKGRENIYMEEMNRELGFKAFPAEGHDLVANYEQTQALMVKQCTGK